VEIVVRKRLIIAVGAVSIAVMVIAYFVMSHQMSPSGENDWNAFTEPKNGGNSFTEPEIVYKADLDVKCYISNSYWARNLVSDLPDCVNTISYSVTNIGNSAASNVYLEIKVDGSLFDSKILASLPVSAVERYTISLTMPYDSSKNLFVYASCSDSDDSESVVVEATLPRDLDTNIAKLYITPNEQSVVALKNQILKDKFFLTPNWMAIRDWVGNNIKYRNDSVVHSSREYWQLPRETIQRGTGDCEDFAILLCSLLRADGWSSSNVYVFLGERDGNYHGWVKIIWEGIGYGIEPQANGWSTVLGDFFHLSGYNAEYAFNDVRFGTAS
jgi:hypothetical protein